jgi:hypothetical protein
MIAVFLLGELTSERFGAGIRAALDAAGQTEALVTAAELDDADQNRARRVLLAVTRGYGEDRDVFERFPARVRWVRAVLTPAELARVRYIEYSYWNELSGGTRLASHAAQQIRQGVTVFGVPNGRFWSAKRAVERGELFLPLILAGRRRDRLICLEGHLRLTAYALAGFPPRLSVWSVPPGPWTVGITDRERSHAVRHSSQRKRPLPARKGASELSWT